MAEQTGRSFIFSKECRKIFHENCKEKHLTFLIDRLSEYGKSELFVIDTKNTAMISLSNLPLALKYHDDQIGAFGEVPIPLWDAGTIPSQVLELLQKGNCQYEYRSGTIGSRLDNWRCESWGAAVRKWCKSESNSAGFFEKQEGNPTSF